MVLREKGYTSYSVPPTKSADELWQKPTLAGETELYINAYVYRPNEIKDYPTVEFGFQNNEIENPMNVKLFGFRLKQMSGRDVEEVEKKLRNLFIYSFYA